MFIKPFIREHAKVGIGERFLIFLLVFFGVFFVLLFLVRTPDKKFEIADLITGDTYILTQDDFYFSDTNIVIKTKGECQKTIKFSEYSYKPL